MISWSVVVKSFAFSGKTKLVSSFREGANAPRMMIAVSPNITAKCPASSAIWTLSLAMSDSFNGDQGQNNISTMERIVRITTPVAKQIAQRREPRQDDKSFVASDR